MPNYLCFFEDNTIVRFYPNALTRPLDQLRFGILTIAEKWEKMLGIQRSTRTLRPWLKGVFDSGIPESGNDSIWINSRFIPDATVVSEIKRLQTGEGITRNGVPVVIILNENDTRKEYDLHQDWLTTFEEHLQNPGSSWKSKPPGFGDIRYMETSSGMLLEHAWDLFHNNAKQIEADLRLLRPGRTLNHISQKNFFYANPDAIYVQPGARLDPGIVLDATEGPIYIGKNAHIMSGALIRGPVAICEHAVVRMGAKIYEGTTAGPHCKLGGEVSTAIFQSYSNKAHDGYVGNSLIGEWVNIGADTNNSNLKNNYSSVKVYDWESGQLKDSGLQFCGLFMADHSKTAINSMLNSGTVCGVSSSILTNNFPDKYIPSYAWVTETGIDVFTLDKALETARIVMARRNVKMTPSYESMMRYLFMVRDGRG